MSGAGQYAFLEPFYNQTVTMAIALCDWNEAKFYKGCIISVMTETETIYNSLNFSNN